jgi:mRNA interferase MazF
MARILRGDVLWAELDPVRGREQGGRRPVVILSEDTFNSKSGTVIAIAITSQPQRAGYPLTLPITSVKLPKPSWAKISQLRTLAVDRLSQRIGRLSGEEVDQLIDGLNEILGR